MGLITPQFVIAVAFVISSVFTVFVWLLFGSLVKKTWYYTLVFGIPFCTVVYNEYPYDYYESSEAFDRLVRRERGQPMRMN